MRERESPNRQLGEKGGEEKHMLVLMSIDYVDDYF
jgi:hypothetical protein